MALEYFYVALIAGLFLLIFYIWLIRDSIRMKFGWYPYAYFGGIVWFIGLIVALFADDNLTDQLRFVVGNMGVIIATALPIAVAGFLNAGWEIGKLDAKVRGIDDDMDEVSKKLGFERRRYGP